MLNDFFVNFYPSWDCQLITPPSVTPVTLDDFKQHSHVSNSFSDTLLLEYLQAATDYCERSSGRAFITQTRRLTLPYFQSAQSPPHQPLRSVFAVLPLWYRDVIPLPKPKLQSVTSITYFDSDGNEQTLTQGTDYIVDTTRIYGSVRPPMNKVWPTTQINNPSCVSIEFVCGYGDDGSAVPPIVKQSIRALTALFNEYREPTITGTILSDVSLGVKQLIDQYRLIEP